MGKARGMSRIVVIGAGVVGQSYAALLARAGHGIVMVARGERAGQLSSDGLRVKLEGELIAAPCQVVSFAGEAGPAEAALLAVRGDQLEAALDQAAACQAPVVVGLTNPLGLMAEATRRVGPERMVWGFSGLGGRITDGIVTSHLVRQQRTLVQAGVPRSAEGVALLSSMGIRVDQERSMAAWFDTHNVFVGGMAAAILAHPDGAAHTAGSWAAATSLVRAMREGFDALEAGGTTVTPKPLRLIFGRVPTPIAAAYWKRQFATPMATVSMEPHARATRDTEMAAVFRHALSLVGDAAPRYRAFIQAAAGPVALSAVVGVQSCNDPAKGGRHGQD